VVVLEEMGRALMCAPYFSTVALATNGILAAGDELARKDLLPGIASGSLPSAGCWRPGPGIAAHARHDQKAARLAFSNTPARLIGSPQRAEQALRDTLDLAVIALAAEMVGGAQRCLNVAGPQMQRFLTAVIPSAVRRLLRAEVD
jgi:alkylation response protein AidB-like acyl-CoA dehydrogenase